MFHEGGHAMLCISRNFNQLRSSPRGIARLQFSILGFACMFCNPFAPFACFAANVLDLAHWREMRARSLRGSVNNL
jgi:hypothetical protein